MRALAQWIPDYQVCHTHPVNRLIPHVCMLAIVLGLLGLLLIFVVAWIGQFLGHMIEDKLTSFFEDLRFLLIGPLSVLLPACERLGLAPGTGSK